MTWCTRWTSTVACTPCGSDRYAHPGPDRYNHPRSRTVLTFGSTGRTARAVSHGSGQHNAAGPAHGTAAWPCSASTPPTRTGHAPRPPPRRRPSVPGHPPAPAGQRRPSRRHATGPRATCPSSCAGLRSPPRRTAAIAAARHGPRGSIGSRGHPIPMTSIHAAQGHRADHRRRPEPGLNPQVLRLLARYRITATFSCGIEAQAYPAGARSTPAPAGPACPRSTSSGGPARYAGPARLGQADPRWAARWSARLVPPRQSPLDRHQHHAHHARSSMRARSSSSTTAAATAPRPWPP